METHDPIIHLDQPSAYEIKVQGRLDGQWSDWLNGVELCCESGEHGAITTLTGVVADQAALFGLLNRIRDLGLPLLSVRHISSERS